MFCFVYRLHLESAPVERVRAGTATAALHTWLRLRSTHPGGSNRLDFVKLVSVDELETVPRPDMEGDRRPGDGVQKVSFYLFP